MAAALYARLCTMPSSSWCVTLLECKGCHWWMQRSAPGYERAASAADAD